MKKSKIFSLILMELSFLVYSCSWILAKLASEYEFPSFKFVLFYGLDVIVLGIYALLWQQVIKRYELAIAYANKAVCLVWALIWGVLIFGERDSIKWNQILGIGIVIAGIVVLNSKSQAKEDKEDKVMEER